MSAGRRYIIKKLKSLYNIPIKKWSVIQWYEYRMAGQFPYGSNNRLNLMVGEFGR